MKALVILNGISARKKYFYHSILPALERVANVVVKETTHAGHAEVLAREFGSHAFDVVFAAGGDGTLHQVLNGLLVAESSRTLGLIPLGTGNDFARSVDVTSDGKRLAESLTKNNPKTIDVGKVKLTDRNGHESLRYFINECSLGMGPEVVRRIQEEGASIHPSLTYYKSIVKTFMTLPRPAIHIQSTEWEWKGKACVFAMANGKAFGHAVYIAPDAQLTDGKLNTFLAGDFPVWRFLLYLQKIKSGKKVQDRKIWYGTTKSIHVDASTPVAIEADGELVGYTPLTTEVIPAGIKFLY